MSDYSIQSSSLATTRFVCDDGSKLRGYHIDGHIEWSVWHERIREMGQPTQHVLFSWLNVQQEETHFYRDSEGPPDARHYSDPKSYEAMGILSV